MADIRLENCPPEIFKCHACNKANMTWWTIAPDEPITHVFNFICAFCKTQSQDFSRKGLAKQGVISKDDSRFYTVTEDSIENDNGVTTFVMKAPNGN